MSKDEALKLALEALETCDFVYTYGNGGYQQFDRPSVDKAITAIKQALAAQQEHEPENEPYVSLASVREDWGPGPHEYHSLPAPVQPTEPGWYVVLAPDFDKPTVRAFGKDGQWWIPLGRGNGDDGWLSGRPYKNWVGPIASIDDGQPFRTTPPAAQPAPVSEGRDWSLLEATQESLREHMAEIKRLKEAQRQWVGLTDDDIAETNWHLSADREYEQWTLQEQLVVCGVKDFARAIEAKLKEKNNG